ncbi:Gfo/Idh/MocA family oxidoreductase [Candidatus Woesearchaeota archaeon]|nr:Gfo/Idh/MocA family oxidoreductase [Candidatus Woesearchaeota archaeon]
MLKLGLIGCGNVVERSHLQSYRDLKELVKVEAVSDLDENKAKKVCAEFGAEYFNNYKEMLNKNLDCVIVSVPIHLTQNIVSNVLKAGKAAITEKPGASNYEEALELVSLSRQNKVPFTFVQNYLYGTKQMQAIEASKNIGEIFLTRLENVCHGYGALEKNFDMGWRLNKSNRGCLLNHGFHEIYLMLHLNPSPVESIYAVRRNFCYNSTEEDLAIVVAKHKNNGITQITNGFLHNIKETVSVEEIHGTKGSIDIKNPPEILKLEKEYSHTRFFREKFLELQKGSFKDNLAEFLTIHKILDAAYDSMNQQNEVFL